MVGQPSESHSLTVKISTFPSSFCFSIILSFASHSQLTVQPLPTTMLSLLSKAVRTSSSTPPALRLMSGGSSQVSQGQVHEEGDHKVAEKPLLLLFVLLLGREGYLLVYPPLSFHQSLDKIITGCNYQLMFGRAGKISQDATSVYPHPFSYPSPTGEAW